MKLELNKKAIIDILLKIKDPAVVMLVTGVLGYTVYQISLLADVSPTRAQVEAERKNAASSVAKFDTKTIEAIVKQNPVPVNTTPQNVGKTNPFF